MQCLGVYPGSITSDEGSDGGECGESNLSVGFAEECGEFGECLGQKSGEIQWKGRADHGDEGLDGGEAGGLVAKTFGDSIENLHSIGFGVLVVVVV